MRWASVISAITRNDPPHNAQMVTSNSNVRLSGPSHGVQPNSSALKELSLRCWVNTLVFVIHLVQSRGSKLGRSQRALKKR